MNLFRVLQAALFLIPCCAFCQGDSLCYVLLARKNNGNREYIFREKDCTSLSTNNGAEYHVPEIISIQNDKIAIRNRGIYSNDENDTIEIPVASIDWINWDGIPRKKLRKGCYNFFTILEPCD